MAKKLYLGKAGAHGAEGGLKGAGVAAADDGIAVAAARGDETGGNIGQCAYHSIGEV